MSLSSISLAVLLSSPLMAEPETESPSTPTAAPETISCPGESTAVKVYDGDTLTLSSGQRIRLAGVNTPELKPVEPFGIEARDAAFAFVAGKKFTVVCGDTPRVDKYKRLVAGIQVGESSLSEHLLEIGYAHIMLIPPVTEDLKPLYAAQARARSEKRGIWKEKRFQGPLHITSFHANAPGDDRLNLAGEYLRVVNVSGEPVRLQGWRIMDASKHSYDLPDLTVAEGFSIEIHSGTGATQADPAQQLLIFLGNTTPLWNNDSDEVSLFDPQGMLVDQRLHKVKGK